MKKSEENSKKSAEQKNTKKPKKIKIPKFFNFLLNKLCLKILLILVAVAFLSLGGKFGWKKLGEIKTEKGHALVFRELERCSELVTAKTKYSDIVSIKKTRIAGFAKTFSIIKYTGTIRAGIRDITKAKIKISNRGKSAKVILPKIEILANDISSIEVFDEGKSIFVSISLKEIMDEIHFNQENASTEIMKSGFLEEAENQAKRIIESILYASGFSEVEVSVEI